MKILTVVMLAAIVGAVLGSASTMAFSNFVLTKSQNDLIKDFYSTENAVHVSPHGLRGKMDKGISDFVLVDLRSRQEYETEHVIGAVSIPAYSDPNTSAYGDVDRIVGAFKALKDANPGKEVIVYCYSMPCMTGRKVGKMMAEHGIYVKHLGIGWNEWRYFWNLWNHELEWNSTKVEDYVTSGPEPGKPKLRSSISPCSLGDFGC
jgi:rhodanese-related sulfurtransferase